MYTKVIKVCYKKFCIYESIQNILPMVKCILMYKAKR